MARLAAIPRNMNSRTQYYRSDVYAEHGLKAAVTWEDMVDVGRKLTGNGYYGLVVPGQGDPAQSTFSDLLWQAGGEWVDETNKPSFNAAPGIEALTYYRDLIHKWKVVPADTVSYQWNENSTQFSSGAARPRSIGGAFATLSNPETSKVAGKCGDRAIHQEQGGDLLRHLARHGAEQPVEAQGPGGRVHQVYGEPGGATPELQRILELPEPDFRREQVRGQASGAKAEWLSQLEQTIATGKEWPKLPGFSRVCTLMFSTIERALSNQATPEDALNQAAAEALQIMTQAGAYD